MTTATTSTPATAPPLTRPPVPPGLRLQLDPSLVGTGAVDGGWWPRSRDPDAETAAQIVMAMAADAGSSAGLADILAAAGIGGQDPVPQAAP
jgi:hypothetical protein